MTVYTEDDGTEIDEDTFSAFICAVGNENWSPLQFTLLFGILFL